VMRNPTASTARPLGFRQIEIPTSAGRWRKRVTPVKREGNNLQNVAPRHAGHLHLRLRLVSGSGKYTLIIETLYKALASDLNGARAQLAGGTTDIDGGRNLNKIVDHPNSPTTARHRPQPHDIYRRTFARSRLVAQIAERRRARLQDGPLSRSTVKGGRLCERPPGSTHESRSRCTPFCGCLVQCDRLQKPAIQPCDEPRRCVCQGQVDGGVLR